MTMKVTAMMTKRVLPWSERILRAVAHRSGRQKRKEDDGDQRCRGSSDIGTNEARSEVTSSEHSKSQFAKRAVAVPSHATMHVANMTAQGLFGGPVSHGI